ncbi:MAG: hypothetical protein FH756_05825 [Firmicutes bacterium]|nr:hypothetical protein [Bacillota bacterium]
MNKVSIPRKAHPLVKEIWEKEIMTMKEAVQFMWSIGVNPRGIGGLSKNDRIKWVKDTKSWILGPRAYDY